MYFKFYTQKVFLNMLLFNFMVGLFIAKRQSWFKLTSNAFRSGISGVGLYYLLSLPIELIYSRKVDKFVDLHRGIVDDLLKQSKFDASLYIAEKTKRR